MNRNHVIAITGLALIFGAGSALADDLEATITVIAEADVATPDVIMHGISLPDQLAENASGDNESANSDGGLGTATDSLANRQTGLDFAVDAIEEVTSDFAEAAQDNAENSSRADDARPDAPGEIPVPPGS